MTFFDSLFGLFFPEPCLRCGGMTNALLCESCWRGVSWGVVPYRIAGVDEAHAIFDYQQPWVQRMLIGIKYEPNKALARRLGCFLADRLSLPMGTDSCCAMVAAPLSERRFKKRRFNQSQVIFEAFRSGAQLPWVTDFVRCKDTPALYSMSLIERQQVLKDAFEWRPHSVPKSVIVVDDILTTGTTLSYIAQCLRKQGVRRIVGLVISQVCVL